MITYNTDFTNIETLTANGATLVGDGNDNTFTVTDLNEGNLDSVVTFTGIHNLSGAAGDDQFIYSTTLSDLTGQIDGGTQNTVAGDRFDITAQGATSVTYGTDFTNIEISSFEQ